MRAVTIEVKDLRVELGGGMDPAASKSVIEGTCIAGEPDSRDVAVNDLGHDQSAVVGHDGKGLGLDIGVLVGAPAQVVLVQLGIGSAFGLTGNGANGAGAVFGLLSANGVCETRGD